MTLFAIARRQRTETEVDGSVAGLLADVQTARPMTALAARLHQPGGTKLPAVAGSAAEPDGMAADAFRVGVSLSFEEGRKGVSVADFSQTAAAPRWQLTQVSVPT